MAQNENLQGETVRTLSNGHMTTAILGNYRPDHDAFDGWILNPGNVQFQVQGNEPVPGFGTNQPWAALTVWVDGAFREWDPSKQDVTQNGQLFIFRGADFLETEFLAYMTKRESLQLPDQFTQPAIDQGSGASDQGSVSGNAPAAGVADPPAPDPPPAAAPQGGGLRKKKKKNLGG